MRKTKILSIILVAIGTFEFGYDAIVLDISEYQAISMIMGLMLVFLGLWLNKAYQKRDY